MNRLVVRHVDCRGKTIPRLVDEITALAEIAVANPSLPEIA
ncbi:MAG: hypothetical protein AAEJ52_20240 [Myxococcota bacterium]